MFITGKEHAKQVKTFLIDKFTKDVYINGQEGTIKLWKERVDILLNKYQKFATRPEDCFWFINNTSIVKNYTMAPYVVDNLDLD